MQWFARFCEINKQFEYYLFHHPHFVSIDKKYLDRIRKRNGIKVNSLQLSIEHQYCFHKQNTASSVNSLKVDLKRAIIAFIGKID